ncbi:MAG: N-6 DNA methylase [Alphaproteobacteria bacterium]|nr:N-6 DNA methylase [Alphaproteobacteria bacterium]
MKGIVEMDLFNQRSDFNAVFSVSNRTNKNKAKKERLKKEYILPMHNIQFQKETIPWLKSLLEMHKNGENIRAILFAVSKQLLGFELIEYKNFDHGLDVFIPQRVKKEKDLIGSVYQYLTPKDARLATGTFYTNDAMIEDIVARLDIKDTDVIFDPAVGSGNLIFNSKITKPEQIVGVDFDELAIFCSKVNYYIKFGQSAPPPRLYHSDFCQFILKNSEEFDYVLCNPPFGATLDVSCLAKSCVSTEDSLTYFVVYAAPLARKQSVFILPESVINVKKHTDLRKWILKNNYLTDIKSYGATFSGTMFPIVTLTLNRNNTRKTFIYDSSKVKFSTILSMPFYYFRPINKENEILIQHVFAKNTQSLRGSLFGLGVVTGNNRDKVFSSPAEGLEPVITGKDITPYNIAKPRKYIKYDRQNLQQVAPDALYRNINKIVYKTVSRNMNFALDTTGTLTLNSANFFIPKNLTISNKCLIALLNSKLYNKLNQLLYGENKISRTNLENLPLPDITKELQIQIESLVDKHEYDRIDDIINGIFDL